MVEKIFFSNQGHRYNELCILGLYVCHIFTWFYDLQKLSYETFKSSKEKNLSIREEKIRIFYPLINITHIIKWNDIKCSLLNFFFCHGCKINKTFAFIIVWWIYFYCPFLWSINRKSFIQPCILTRQKYVSYNIMIIDKGTLKIPELVLLK